MLKLLSQTRAEQRGYRNGISLFFGALLGAQLGTLQALPLRDYAGLIAMLAIIVVLLQLIGHARSWIYAASALAVLAALLAFGWADARLRPDALPLDDFNKLAATLGIWLAMALTIELSPTIDDRGVAARGDAGAIDGD